MISYISLICIPLETVTYIELEIRSQLVVTTMPSILNSRINHTIFCHKRDPIPKRSDEAADKIRRCAHNRLGVEMSLYTIHDFQHDITENPSNPSHFPSPLPETSYPVLIKFSTDWGRYIDGYLRMSQRTSDSMESATPNIIKQPFI
ncbi:hypothetical protein RF11_13609 [Thelohanellus kitauei]|uniref:Uncharacterized protein n=1 Tax=Thelohanellus kitauei TaxID=669202 RepID=A0A0C2MPU6_THEKT|nr:hypothetical protein RF11_13609 [Thelohanellus kitauei]